MRNPLFFSLGLYMSSALSLPDRVAGVQDKTRRARQRIEQLQQRLEEMDEDDESDDGADGAAQLTREQMEQMLGSSPLHAELRRHLEKVLAPSAG